MRYEIDDLRQMAETVARVSGLRYVGQLGLEDAYAFIGPKHPDGSVVLTDYIGKDDNGGDLFAAVGYVIWE
jgi:hypothetical protein